MPSLRKILAKLYECPQQSTSSTQFIVFTLVLIPFFFYLLDKMSSQPIKLFILMTVGLRDDLLVVMNFQFFSPFVCIYVVNVTGAVHFALSKNPMSKLNCVSHKSMKLRCHYVF